MVLMTLYEQIWYFVFIFSLKSAQHKELVMQMKLEVEHSAIAISEHSSSTVLTLKVLIF